MKLLVIGAGIAGLSTAAQAAADFEVTVLEAELQPGYHSSGRSAAVFIRPYVNAVVHALSAASESFFSDPPKGFGTLGRRTATLVAAEFGDEDRVDAFIDRWAALCPWLAKIDAAETCRRVPIFRPERIACAALDDRCMALDVHNILEGHRRRLLEHDGVIVTNARVVNIERHARWHVETDRGEIFSADIVVNAAGAWADQIAVLAGATPLALVPKRRTAILIEPGIDVREWPLALMATDDLYFKPEGNLLMVSPVDATQSPPCDAQPQEWDIAVGIERFQNVTNVTVDRPTRTWAGLRTFTRDECPVIGYDAAVEGFFWVAGQGGFGVQTSPGYSRVAAALLNGVEIPADIEITAADVDPRRDQSRETP
ncbi:MAG: FAD-binding oxidoreductase [Gammaproteobacteria bacterium]|nr:FAD-binding oxidoreductase [Gammaproteobacteria bacterium]